MNTTQQRYQLNGVEPVPSIAASLSPAVALVEGAHLAGVVTVLMSQAWLQTFAEGVTMSHNLTLASLGIHSSQHVAAWDNLATSIGSGWFEAMDKVLKTMGD